MAGGSQLSQLKGRLRASGLQRSDVTKGSKKKTKRPEHRDPESRAKKLASISEEFNVFDFKTIRPKHAVASNKDSRAKGQANRIAGKPSMSKSTAIEQRRNTLLPELMDRNRQGGIIDRRFGEDNPYLTPEEKNLERFTRERQRATAAGGQIGKRGLFNLEEEDELTHLGKSLSDQQAFGDSDVGLPQEQAFAQYKRDQTDAGVEDEPPRKRSRAEIMEEVVAKSKAYKYERQRAKDEDDDLRQELDNDLDSLRAALGGRATSKTTEVASLVSDAVSESEQEEPAAVANVERARDPSARSGIDRALLAKIIGSPSVTPEPEETSEPDIDEDDFDRYVRELAFEGRARPQDRLQTDEERALQAQKELLQQEERRKKRMLGLVENSDDESERRKRKKMPQGDDLEDDFDLGGEDEADEFGLGGGLTESGAFTLTEDVPDSAALDQDPQSESEDTVGDVNDEESEPSDLMGDLEGEEQEGSVEEPEELVVKSSKKTNSKLKTNTTLAFTYDCPSTHEDFLEILSSASEDQLGVVIDRIRVLHHPQLAEENKDKLAMFLGVLIDHVVHVAASQQSFQLMNTMAPHIFSLCNSYPLSAAQHFASKLSMMQKNFVRGLTKSPLLLEARTWPGPSELAILRLVGLVWSTSDFSHPIVAPALLLTCQYLGQSRIRSASDLASGLMLCGICLEYESISKRIIPEILNFLVNSLLLLSPHNFKTADSLPGSFAVSDAFRQEIAHLRLARSAIPETLGRLHVSALLRADNSQPEASDKQNLLCTTVLLLDRFSQLYASSQAFLELFTPIHAILTGIASKALPEALQTLLARLQSDLERILKLARSSRKPLRLQQHRAVPIATYLPKFEDNYRPGQQSFDPDTTRTETAKLKALVKKEKKGAVRELRKDNKFLANEQAKIRQEKDAAYKQKITSIKAGLNAERSEEKEYERTKKKLRALDKKRGGGK